MHGLMHLKNAAIRWPCGVIIWQLAENLRSSSNFCGDLQLFRLRVFREGSHPDAVPTIPSGMGTIESLEKPRVSAI